MKDPKQFRRFNAIVMLVLGVLIPGGCLISARIRGSQGFDQPETYVALLSLGCAGIQLAAWIVGEIVYFFWRSGKP